jgi:hypothetical protein
MAHMMVNEDFLPQEVFRIAMYNSYMRYLFSLKQLDEQFGLILWNTDIAMPV